VRRKPLLFVVITLGMLLSCNSAQNRRLDIELLITPSFSRFSESEGYRIVVEGNSLSVTARGVWRHDSILPVQKQSVTLSDESMDTISEYVSGLRPHASPDSMDGYTLDVWGYVLTVGGREYARFDSGSILEEPHDENLRRAQKLIDYLIKLSPLVIRLRGFA
jgi:hypothetical protein